MMRKQKYGVRAKDVALAVKAMGLDCSERTAQGALKAFAEHGTRFESIRAAAGAIAAQKHNTGCYPRIPDSAHPAKQTKDEVGAYEREVGHAVLLLRSLGFKLEVA